MRRVNCLRLADVNSQARWRVLHPSWRDEDLSLGVGRRGEAKDWVLHRDFEPEDLDIAVPGSRNVVSIGVSNDSVDHPDSMTARGPDGFDESEALLPH
jgi:hypothetical protein